jgi:hypothetical protein
MFYKIKGGSIEHIQGIDCNIPPVGKGWDPEAKLLIEIGVYKRSQKKSDQKWERPPAPSEKKFQVEAARRKHDDEYRDEDLEVYRRKEWDRRLCGFWFMNNGTPVYLTGLHYFYLTHWQIDIGYPEFRDTDRKWFYFLEYCDNDPNCGGILDIEKRRGGKSYRGAAYLYERLSRSGRKLGAIQSKTREDAKALFAEKLIEPFQSVPEYFVPEYDSTGGKRPKNELRFFATNRRGQVAEENSSDLASLINFRDSGEKAYDGRKIYRGLIDEYGKTVGVDIVERHRTLKYCILQDTNIIGKLLYATTVEDMGGGDTMSQVKELWNTSDPAKRNKNGRTQSLLYRYFIPAYECLEFDAYGYPKIEESVQNLNNTFEDYVKSGDHRGLASEKRKNPFTIDDVFRSDGETCLFNAIQIANRLAELSRKSEGSLYETGNFVWEDEDKVRVKWLNNPNGKFKVRKFIEDANAVRFYGDIKVANNYNKYVIGVDPFDHDFSSGTPSNGAFYVFNKQDPSEPEYSNSLICEYCARPTPNEFYEDVIKAAHYYGCKILFENNKYGIKQYLNGRGYGKFAIWFNAVEIYFSENMGRIFYPKLLEEALDFNISNTTKFDKFMAFMWTIVASRHLLGKVSSQDGKLVDIGNYIRSYKVKSYA